MAWNPLCDQCSDPNYYLISCGNDLYCESCYQKFLAIPLSVRSPLRERSPEEIEQIRKEKEEKESKVRHEYDFFNKIEKVGMWVSVKIPDEDPDTFVANIRSSLNYYKVQNYKDFKTRVMTNQETQKNELIIERIK